MVGARFYADVRAHHAHIEQAAEQALFHVIRPALDAHHHVHVATPQFPLQRVHPRQAGLASWKPFVVVEYVETNSEGVVEQLHLINQVGHAAKTLDFARAGAVEGVDAAKSTVAIAAAAADDRSVADAQVDLRRGVAYGEGQAVQVGDEWTRRVVVNSAIPSERKPLNRIPRFRGVDLLDEFQQGVFPLAAYHRVESRVVAHQLARGKGGEVAPGRDVYPGQDTLQFRGERQEFRRAVLENDRQADQPGLKLYRLPDHRRHFG